MQKDGACLILGKLFFASFLVFISLYIMQPLAAGAG
jgi:hypothetical protein